MNRYIIEYHSKTRVALNKRKEQQTLPLNQWLFNYPNLQDCKLAIVVKDRVIKRNDINLHTGLNIFTDIITESEQKAIEITKEHVETILSLISFTTFAYCDAAMRNSIISVEKEVHPFRCNVYPFGEQEILGSLIKIDQSEFSKIFESYEKSDEKPRILRALSWLRKGMGEENPVDEFISYWTGLEVIKSILRRNLKTKIQTVLEWDGVENIFTRELKFYKFEAIKDARRRLFHGGKEEDTLDNNFMEEIKGYLEPMRKALIYCIGNILTVEHDIIVGIANKTPQRIELNPWSVIKGKLKNLPSDFVNIIQSYPTLDANMFDKQYSINAEGALTINGKTSHHFMGGSGIKLEKLEIELWGKKEAGIEQFTVGEISIDKARKLSSD